MKWFAVFSLLVFSQLVPLHSSATTCEEGRAQYMQNFNSNCGPSFCRSEAGGTYCKSYLPVTWKRFGNGYAALCAFNWSFSDAAGTNASGYGEESNGYIDDCSEMIPPKPDPGGPSGSGVGGAGSGGCIGKCCSPSPGLAGGYKITGSIVNLQAQTLGEIIPLVGSSFSLYYYSSYQLGRVANFLLKFPLSGDTPRDYITSFGVETRRGGVLLDSATFGNTLSNQVYTYSWDGLNAAGTSPVDSAEFKLTVTEVSPSGSFTTTHDVTLSHWDVRSLGLGGWLPTNLHHYDVLAKRLYYANGDYRNVTANSYGTSQLYVSAEDGSEVYTFDSNGNHVATKTGLLGTTKISFAYDTSGRILTITEPFSRITTFNRNTSGNLTSISAPNGQIMMVTLDSNGYLATMANPNSETYTLSYYGTQGLLRTFTKPNGEVSTFEYDSEGYLTKDTHSGGYFFELVQAINSNIAYDVTSTTVMGRSENVRTDVASSSVQTTITKPSGATYYSYFNDYGTSFSRYDGGDGYTSTVSSALDPRYGEMAKIATNRDISPNGGGTRSLILAESISLSDPNDPFSISSWSTSANLTGANTTTTTVFDPLTKKFTTSTYMGKTSETTIDNYERPVSFKIGSLNATSLNYTNEKLTSIAQGTRTTTLAYNTLGLLQSVMNPLSQTTSYVYNAANRLTAKVFPDSRVVGFSYDGVGNLTGVTPPGRPLHSFGLNGHGLVGSYQPPTLSGVSTVNTAYTYNLDKQLTNITRPNGEYVAFNFNATTGVLESLDTSAGNFPYSIDATIGLPTSIATPSNVSMNLGYVGRELASAYTYVNGTSVGSYAKTYGSYNHVDSDTVTSGGAGSTTSAIAYLYNDDEDLKKSGDVTLTYNTPNGQLTGTTMGSGTTGFTDTYTYNTYGEVTNYVAKRGTTTIYDLTLARDGSGRVNGKTQVMNSITNNFVYGFDTSGRLEQVTKNSSVVANYGYDSNSNRNSGNVGAQPTTATYDDQDRLLTYNTLSFTYNANGDLLSKTNSTTSQTTQYTYDVFGNLTQVVLPGGTTTITYEIDGLNRRIGKKVNGVVQKRWVYMDQYRIAAELNASGTITKRFIYGSKGNIPDYMIASGVKYRIISDHLGSPRLVVKQSDGTITQRMDHDEFGRVTEDTNPGYLPFGFAGGLYDNQTGLVRFGARDYDSETGRWTSKDPILFGGGDTNLFGYVANDPINWFDQSGLLPDQVKEGETGFKLGVAIFNIICDYMNSCKPIQIPTPNPLPEPKPTPTPTPQPTPPRTNPPHGVPIPIPGGGTNPPRC